MQKKMFLSDGLKKATAFCVVASWAFMAGMACADALEDIREVSAHEDQVADQVILQALSTPAILPGSLSFDSITPRPTLDSHHSSGIDVPGALQLSLAQPLIFVRHDPPLRHRFKLFQLFSVYRL